MEENSGKAGEASPCLSPGLCISPQSLCSALCLPVLYLARTGSEPRGGRDG